MVATIIITMTVTISNDSYDDAGDSDYDDNNDDVNDQYFNDNNNNDNISLLKCSFRTARRRLA